MKTLDAHEMCSYFNAVFDFLFLFGKSSDRRLYVELLVRLIPANFLSSVFVSWNDEKKC